MKHLDCDVAVVGAGPTGLALANDLGQAGIRAVLIERNDTTVQQPRAVSIDDEALRAMQGLGLIENVLTDVALDYGSHYFTPDGTCFAKVEPTTREYGFPRRNAFLQPRLEATLRKGLDRFPNVTLLFRHERQRLAEDKDGVTLGLSGPDGEDVSVRARYVVACDGGRSPIREELGIPLAGSTYDQRWLIVDLGSTQERFRQTRVLCNPDRPALTLPGPHGTRRYEFMLHDGETDEIATAPEFVRNLLQAHGPDADAPVVRRQVYHFHARVADRWQTERVFLAGDAAHLSPPFAGQGMNSGLRDAHNLGWKLASVVQGGLGPGLLNTYEQERLPHARALIQLAVNMGRVMMPRSKFQASLVQSGFRVARLLPPVQDYFAQMRYKPKPFYKKGFLAEDDGLGLVGRMLPQPVLEFGPRERVLLDDVIGSGFALICYGRNAQKTADALAGFNFGLPRPKRLAVVPAHYNLASASAADIPAGRDVEDRLGRLAAEDHDVVIVLRPDRYVAAAARITQGGAVERLAACVRAIVGRTWTNSGTEHEGFDAIRRRPAA
jgi:3-(3-hydroxy-phenyl)propionate hydroxylase